MKRLLKKTISCFISILLMMGLLTPAVHAEEIYPEPIDGTYQFTSAEGSGIMISDTFEFREDCFMRSSFLGCGHLALLSAQAASASYNFYPPTGEGEAPGKDTSQGGKTISELLESAGFEEVEVNNYYSADKLENSVGAAVGKRTITVSGQSYTLLAIIPRSIGYRQEWAGDLAVDDSGIHGGFKDARDEVLRFVKQYIRNHHITGALKIWTAGHSRGGATANLLAGFLAGGGIEYFGEDVSITPEDIYCYTYSAPSPIKDGILKQEELSVAPSGTRAHHITSADDRADYSKNDTFNEEYISSASGTVNPADPIYNGIRNYYFEGDFISNLPPEKWGFSLYGTRISISQLKDEEAGVIVTIEDMLNELEILNPYVYNTIHNSGNDSLEIVRYTFDPNTLSLVKDTKPHQATTLVEFIRERIAGLTLNMASTKEVYEYEETPAGYISRQNAMRHTGGLYGTLNELPSSVFHIEISSLISPGLLFYLAYAHERLGRSESEDACTALAQILQIVTGTDRDLEHGTVDDAFVALCTWMKGNPDLVKRVSGEIPSAYAVILKAFIESVLGTSYSDLDSALIALLNACTDEATGTITRMTVYGMLTGILALLNADLAKAFQNGGQNPFSTLSDGVVSYLKSGIQESASFSRQFLYASQEASEEVLSMASGAYAEEETGSEELSEKAEAVIEEEPEEKTEEIAEKPETEKAEQAEELSEKTADHEALALEEPLPEEEPMEDIENNEDSKNPESSLIEADENESIALETIPEETPEEEGSISESEADEEESLLRDGSTLSLAEAADAKLIEAIRTIINDELIEYCRTNYGDNYASDVRKHREGLILNIDHLRIIIGNTLFYTEDTDAFNAQAMLDTALTLAGNAWVVPAAHYNDTNLAWMKAAVKKGYYTDHAITHEDAKKPTHEEEGNIEYWKVHERTGDHYYTDANLTNEVDRSETILPKIPYDGDDGEKESRYIPPVINSGCPANQAWNEAAKACEPGYLDENGVFRSAKVRAVNTYDPGIGKSALSLTLSMVTAVFAWIVLKRN